MAMDRAISVTRSVLETAKSNLLTELIIHI